MIDYRTSSCCLRRRAWYKAIKPEFYCDLPDVRRQLPETLKRISRLRESGLLSRCVYTILESFGRQTYLDDFEAKLLTFMEQNYGIEN